MKKILSELIALEQRAKAIIKPAERELANFDNIIKRKAESVACEVDKNVAVKIAQMRKDSADFIALQKAEIDKEAAADLAKMDDEWTLNAPKWQAQILDQIISPKGCPHS